MTRHVFQAGLVGALLAGGSLFAMTGAASASTRPHSFAHDQKLLEQQLTSRASQLVHLGTVVTASATLTAPHVLSLKANIATATTNIDALIVKVPTDTTEAQLKLDRTSMLAQNRVFAVLTPQVYLTIEADSVTAQVTVFEANESSLQADVTALIGLPGYKTARDHYTAFVKSVNSAAAEAGNVATTVLAQTPSDYPHDTHIFVSANHQLLNADIALAHASYDESVIGLASGGYTGA